MSDETEIPRLSPSIAKKLIFESPRAAWCEHRLLGNERKEVDPDKQAARDRGTAIHSFLLEDGAGLACLPFDAFRSNESKAAREEARDRGLLPLAKPKYEAYKSVAGRIARTLLTDFGLKLTGGLPEQRIAWDEVWSGGIVDCSGVCDYVTDDTLYEVKTLDSAITREVCERRMAASGDAMQCAAYDSRFGGALEIIILYCSTQIPYSVIPLRYSGSMAQVGETQWQMAVERWGQCLATDTWPGPVTEIEQAQAPKWAVKYWLEREEMEHAA